MSYQVTWEFTKETYPEQPELRRIRALVDLPKHGVKAGDLGGWVEKPENLQGNAWVYDNARVYDDARVCGNALVSGNAHVSGNALVFDHASVYGNAGVYNNARVSGNARVYDASWVVGYAQVFDNARVFGDACVCDDVRVFDKAQVFDKARVSGNAHVFGNALVFDHASVCGYAQVHGNAQVFDKARVYGNARFSGNALVDKTNSYVTFQNIGSENGILTVYKTETGLGCTRGCFIGTVEEFLAASAKKHVGDLAHIAEEYKLMIEVAKMRIKKSRPENNAIIKSLQSM